MKLPKTIFMNDTGLPMRTKFLYINTMGCQMNVYDSVQIQNRLAPLGYHSTDDLEQADVIIVNTCSIRDKAEQKAFSFLGRLAPLKERKPGLIIGIGGCVAQQQGRQIVRRMPYVDLVFGTHAIGRLPDIITRIETTRCRVVDIEIAEQVTSDDFTTGPYPQSDTSAYITIMRGCDNYCTYCIVPYVRGRESSRAPEDIVAEVVDLTSKGIREVTLLGQNVNSYGHKEGLCSFAQLLTRINAVEGLKRIRFTTSHPKDLSDELVHAFQRLDKLCDHIHLPVQSGSDRVLKRMNRRYTRKQYLDKVDRLRAVSPQIAITSDIIVGFPGESDADFEATLALIQQVGFDSLFAFMYSDRPNAPAVQFGHKVPEAIAKDRLQAVLALQSEFTLAKNQALVGTVQSVLVDGLSRSRNRDAAGDTGTEQSTAVQWSGRACSNKIVHFFQDEKILSDNHILTGKVMDIMIKEALPHCLWGRPLSPQIPMGSSGKGDQTYAA
jgi:tRNA-2-methylthio-N6-dimethylallyladenosine synthase